MNYGNKKANPGGLSDSQLRAIKKLAMEKPDFAKFMKNKLTEDPVYKKSGGKIYNCR